MFQMCTKECFYTCHETCHGRQPGDVGAVRTKVRFKAQLLPLSRLSSVANHDIPCPAVLYAFPQRQWCQVASVFTIM